MDDKDIELSYQMSHRAKLRIADEGIPATDINNYIASLTDISRSPLTQRLPEQSERIGRVVGMYAYLRDNVHAKTVGEAWASLEERKVDPKVVKLWVEEEMAESPGIFEAVSRGYPELREDLDRIRKESADKMEKK